LRRRHSPNHSRVLFTLAVFTVLPLTFVLGGRYLAMSDPAISRPTSAHLANALEDVPPADLREPTAVRVEVPRGQRTVESVLATLREPVREEFERVCREKAIPFPPPRITLIGLKQERLLEVWGAGSSGAYRRIATYPVRAASGTAGPKRREGDFQVPEGIYKLDVLNANSRFHLSLRVNYPDADDIKNRILPEAPLGGDIYVHGNQVSIGCLALGDAAIEEVFTLVALARPNQRRILIAPWDLRLTDPPTTKEAWLKARYARLKREMAKFPRDADSSLQQESRQWPYRRLLAKNSTAD
jgi:hypothetical protein